MRYKERQIQRSDDIQERNTKRTINTKCQKVEEIFFLAINLLKYK